MDFDLGATNEKLINKYTCTSAGDRSIEFSLVIKMIKDHRFGEVQIVAKLEIGLYVTIFLRFYLRLDFD